MSARYGRGVRRRRGSVVGSVAAQNSMVVTPAAFTIPVGTPQIVTAVILDASSKPLQNQAVSWATSDTTVANPTLSTGTGPYQCTVAGTLNGTATITASGAGVSANAIATITNPPATWGAPLIGASTAVFMASPGTTGSSQQRIEWSAIAQAGLDTQWAYASNLPGAYPLLGGAAPSNSGYMQYYDGAINHWAFALMLNEGAHGTYKNRGDAIAAQYIAYCASVPQVGGLQHNFPETLLGYYLLYGDATAFTLLQQYTRWWNGSNASMWPDAIRAFSNSAIREGREMARLILMGVSMYKAGIVTPQRVAVGAYLRTYATPLAMAQDYCAVVMEKQLADGSWNMGPTMRQHQYNFHAALLCDAMWKCHQVSNNAAIVTSITSAAAMLKNTIFNTGWPYTGSNPFYGQGMADYNVDTLGASYTVPFSSTPVGAGGVGMNIDLGNLFAPLFYRLGDAAFARQLLGTIQANAYGTSQARYGHMGVAKGSGAFPTTGGLTQNKQMNEFIWQAWEYMP